MTKTLQLVRVDSRRSEEEVLGLVEKLQYRTRPVRAVSYL